MRRPKTSRSSRSLAGTFPRRSGAFTFVEIIVALAIGATVIGAAVMAFSTINSQGLSRRQLNIDIGIQNAYGFYRWTEPQTAVSEAPSFAATAMANSLREQFLGDLASASAVVCLARNKPNTIRPSSIAVPTNVDLRTLITPEDFRTRLIDSNNAVYTNFSTNSYGNGATVATNSSVYMLYADSTTNVWVDAIYESDLVTVSDPVGVYASVRRYVGTNMTAYYHVFYPGATNDAFRRPAAAFFTKSSTTLGNARYRQAENRPFYFLWWPDPSRRDIASPYPSATTNAASPRSDYMMHAGATSFFLCFPAFPPL